MYKETDWDLYEYWLAYNNKSSKDSIADDVINSIIDNLENNPAYQTDATVNGNSQPIIATRSETKKSKITVIPGDKMAIGDLIYVFKDYWLCMSLYTDEYGITYGEIWLCNQIFKFQNNSPDVILKHAILDDGTYSKTSEKPISITSNTFTCYMSLDSDSEKLFVDKRLAIDTLKDYLGRPILDVGKIAWIDAKSKNYGEGSHLLKFLIENDVYKEVTDNIDLNICDYIITGSTTEPSDVTGSLIIDGRDSMRIGTTRTYTVYAIDSNGNKISVSDNMFWQVSEINGVKINQLGTECSLSIALDYRLIGSVVELQCTDLNGVYPTVTKILEVATIG